MTDGRHPMTGERALRLAVPALGLALAVVLLLTSTHLTGGSGWYARVLVVLFGVVALVGLIVEIVRFVRHAPAPVPIDPLIDVDGTPEPHETDGNAALIRVGIVVASILAMVLLANILGLWLAMVIPVVATLLVLGVRTWWKVLLATALTVAGGYIVFTLLLQVRVPEGILGLL
ncbi:tripartite tricarboxylate transporter TctB family protein [Pseudolysinimonas sp.]|uniref:tripartite tricarboxylate transporter TctB family protein n=1 Tax=Pseudolysinimonas sp. TaxID=2680009 RepID=UPI00378307D0